MLQRKWGMHHPQAGNSLPRGGRSIAHVADGDGKRRRWRPADEMCSVFGRQHDGCEMAFRIGDDANAQRTMNHVVRFQRRTRLKRDAVRLPLLDVDVAPVATGMAPEVRDRVQATRADQAVDTSAEDERP